MSLSRFVCAAPWQNNGQGLGFVVGGGVLDKRGLKEAFFKLIAGLSSIVGYLLVLADTSALNDATSDEFVACDLTSVQKAMARAMFVERNES